MTRSNPLLSSLEAELAALECAGLRRDADPVVQVDAVSFCSNDYLGFASLDAVGGPRGAGASRLIAGNHPEIRALERELADWLGTEDTLVFTSGYAANVGLLSALASREDFVVSDVLNHASIIDGLRLSRAHVEIVPHADVAAIEAALEKRGRRRAWVVVESYYSMDADGHDPLALDRICRAAGAHLVVDEAHALALLGDRGRGRYLSAGVAPDALVGTLSKALGTQGGFVAGPRILREWLWNRARSLVFATGIAPVVASSARDSIARVRREPDRAARVLALAERLRGRLRDVAGDAVLGFGHVVPVTIGSARAALAVSASMRAQGIDVVAIRPPTVPPHASRLRFTVTARHDEAAIDRAAEAFGIAWARRED